MTMRPLSVLSFLATLAVAAPSLAQAPDCPSGPAVDGVYVGFDDRSVRYQRLSTGITSELEVGFDGSFVYEYRTHPLGLILESWEVENGRMNPGNVETVTLTGSPDPMPLPAPGVTWSGTEVSVYSDGTVTRYATNLTVEDPDILAIEACDYVALPITINRVDMGDGAVLTDAMVYLQDLGIAVFVGFSEGGAAIDYDLPLSIGVRQPSSGPAPRVDDK